MAKKAPYDGRANLIPNTQLSEEKVKAMQSKGGKASGVARRKKADLKKAVLAAMQAAVKDPKLKGFADKLGVAGGTNLEMLVGVALGKALQGDAKHAENLVKWGGLFNEKVENVNTHRIVDQTFEDVDLADLGEKLTALGKRE